MLINKSQRQAGLHAEALGSICSSALLSGLFHGRKDMPYPNRAATRAETSHDQFRRNQNKIKRREELQSDGNEGNKPHLPGPCNR